ncbi:MAG: hypothetical protein JXB18_02870 [Sedimentisphaerales bacterium]|nr:hypothetical protein [Sedimentisphaerales bacterium]
MQFNKVRSYVVPLKADELSDRLDAAINHECKGEFYFFLLQYHFRAHKNSNYFTLAPMSRGIVIEGFLKDNSENECCVNIRLMPPAWVGFLFVWFPLPLLLLSGLGAYHLFAFCFVFGHLFLGLNMLTASTLFNSLDQVFASLDAVSVQIQAMPRPFIWRKIGLYILIAIGYIVALFLMAVIFKLAQ